MLSLTLDSTQPPFLPPLRAMTGRLRPDGSYAEVRLPNRFPMPDGGFDTAACLPFSCRTPTQIGVALACVGLCCLLAYVIDS